jgi:hypothetical protein
MMSSLTGATVPLRRLAWSASLGLLHDQCLGLRADVDLDVLTQVADRASATTSTEPTRGSAGHPARGVSTPTTPGHVTPADVVTARHNAATRSSDAVGELARHASAEMPRATSRPLATPRGQLVVANAPDPTALPPSLDAPQVATGLTPVSTVASDLAATAPPRAAATATGPAALLLVPEPTPARGDRPTHDRTKDPTAAVPFDVRDDGARRETLDLPVASRRETLDPPVASSNDSALGALGDLVQRWDASALASAPAAATRRGGAVVAGAPPTPEPAGGAATSRSWAGAPVALDELESALDELIRREIEQHGLDREVW